MMAEAADDALPKQKQTYQIEAKNLQKGLAKMWNNTCLFDIKVSHVHFLRNHISSFLQIKPVTILLRVLTNKTFN